MSSFSGLSTALTGLYANRRGMEVTGHNIANVNTDGYSRQRVDLQAIHGPLIPGIHAQASPVGSGVMVDQVQRVRDTFLENRGRIEHGQAAYLDGKGQLLGRVEQAFSEPSETGLQSQLAEMWNSFADLALRPGQPAVRTAVLQRASTVADSIRGAGQQLASLWQTSREQLETMVTEVNTIATNVAELNRAVVASTAAGQPTNDLADQRDLLVMKLAEMTGARAVARNDGSVDVHLGGSSLVYGVSARRLEVFGATRMSEQGTDPVELRWTDNDTVAAAPSGRMAAVMEGLSTTLPDYVGRLDAVAANLATSVNTQHALGFDRSGVAGGAFFSGSTAETLQVAITDPDDVAAASSAGASLDGGNADALADLAKADNGPDRRYRQVVVDLGVQAQTVIRRSQIQASVVSEVDAARAGQSGVNLDEEMTNMIAFERAYQAAAKVISTIDEMLDTLINRMGR